jgi:hypothetical protein
MILLDFISRYATPPPISPPPPLIAAITPPLISPRCRLHAAVLCHYAAAILCRHLLRCFSITFIATFRFDFRCFTFAIFLPIRH